MRLTQLAHSQQFHISVRDSDLTDGNDHGTIVLLVVIYVIPSP
jgi:hypothetical protein